MPISKVSRKSGDMNKGRIHHPLYKVYRGMLNRCYQKTNPKYPLYGGKGIEVCERWRRDVLNFVEDMGDRPSNTTLDRIDSTKGYNKENCRWASHETQNRNRSCCVLDATKVSNIKYGLKQGYFKFQLAEIFGCSVASIVQISAGNRWKEVEAAIFVDLPPKLPKRKLKASA